MLLVTLLAVLLGWHLHRVEPQRRAIAALRAAGALVYQYEVDPDGEGFVHRWVRPLVGDDMLYDVTKVSLWGISEGARLADEEVVGLIINYRAIMLRRPPMVERHSFQSALNGLCALTKMKVLDLEYLPLIESDLNRIGQLDHLEELAFHRIPMDTMRLDGLARLSNLDKLIFIECNVSDEEVNRLHGALRDCEILCGDGHYGRRYLPTNR
jgi:hypothetical protein